MTSTTQLEYWFYVVHSASTIKSAAAAAVVLVLLGAAYYLTYEPAPIVAIQWADNVPPERRAALERRLRLVRPNYPERRSLTYELLDTSASNIRAIVNQPEIEETQGFDLTTYTVRADLEYGESWMWVGDRTPLLRFPGVVHAVVIGCGAVLVYALTMWALGRLR